MAENPPMRDAHRPLPDASETHPPAKNRLREASKKNMPEHPLRYRQRRRGRQTARAYRRGLLSHGGFVKLDSQGHRVLQERVVLLFPLENVLALKHIGTQEVFGGVFRVVQPQVALAQPQEDEGVYFVRPGKGV